MRNALQEMPHAATASNRPTAALLSRLTHPAELALIRVLAGWPRMVESAATAYEPHRIAFYLHDVAAEFHGLWNLGNDDIGLRFLVKDDIELTAARLVLARAMSLVVASGLMVLGVEPVEEMR
jgi:arginyl-tRNA synthetase